LIILIGLICGIIIFLTLKIYLLALLLLFVSFYGFYNFILWPRWVNIDIDGIRYGNCSIVWDNIEKVDFAVGPGRDYRDTIIRIIVRNDKHTIHTQLYKNSKELRIAIENICKEKGIKYIVGDRGSY
jgi:hypothetical protein